MYYGICSPISVRSFKSMERVMQTSILFEDLEAISSFRILDFFLKGSSFQRLLEYTPV